MADILLEAKALSIVRAAKGIVTQVPPPPVPLKVLV